MAEPVLTAAGKAARTRFPWAYVLGTLMIIGAIYNFVVTISKSEQHRVSWASLRTPLIVNTTGRFDLHLKNSRSPYEFNTDQGITIRLYCDAFGSSSVCLDDVAKMIDGREAAIRYYEDPHPASGEAQDIIVGVSVSGKTYMDPRRRATEIASWRSIN